MKAQLETRHCPNKYITPLNRGADDRGGTDKKLTSVILLERKISEKRMIFSFVPAIFLICEAAPNTSETLGF